MNTNYTTFLLFNFVVTRVKFLELLEKIVVKVMPTKYVENYKWFLSIQRYPQVHVDTTITKCESIIDYVTVRQDSHIKTMNVRDVGDHFTYRSLSTESFIVYIT